ncbi:hypothetical protein [Pseudoalteromonas sp. MTN2-4]|uniref:hypothetical protein n=1 Tax=Pseudoalteromonas sp. MTN2-4 TaxID=3056555 RepID=UPI0036F420A9
MNKITKDQFDERELEELNPRNELHWKLWAYDDECCFEMEWDGNQLIFIEFLKPMLKYVTDPNCIKKDTILEALFELAREEFRGRHDSSITQIVDSIKDLKAEGELGEWCKYVSWLNKLYLYRGKFRESEAINLCKYMILPHPNYDELEKARYCTFSFTGRVLKNYSEIKCLVPMPEGALELPEYMYINLNELDWKYNFRLPLELNDI